MSKRAKQFNKLLHSKLHSSDEMVRLLELDGWIDDPDEAQEGSHRHMIHPSKKGKLTIPMGRKTLTRKTRDSILKDAGLAGD